MTPPPHRDSRRRLLSETAKAIHTLFFGTEQAHARYVALEESVTTDEELLALQRLRVGLIHLDPPSAEEMEHVRKRFLELEAREAQRPKRPNPRIVLDGHKGPEGEFARRLLRRMYTNWQGTLDYERGVHRFVFYSPFDEEARRHTTFVSVIVDGEETDLNARDYVLSPYLRVIDRRTRLESDDPWRVLGGDLTPILPSEGESA